MIAKLEHANITVSNADETAAWMAQLFGWHVRWDGPALDGGRSIHIGSDSQYLALYQPAKPAETKQSSYSTRGGLNHLAVEVSDIESMEREVEALGFTAENHADYEPGRRFYFHDRDGIEYEIVQYE
ncbi:MAG: VOC family protein [Pseudomonadota bacterium]